MTMRCDSLYIPQKRRLELHFPESLSLYSSEFESSSERRSCKNREVEEKENVILWQ